MCVCARARVREREGERVCVCGRGGMCTRACVRALRIVSTDKILRFIPTVFSSSNGSTWCSDLTLTCEERGGPA